ncbi:MAG: molybdopterin-guanine dinucleotide biosynthesis protein B [Hydrogenophaga sp.]|jgi:molybdopterin-guanine dinucleotide biosynthesis protein B|uniref:molybdopterin-guanine dinucleotide biosynthesis protein B n=2 Tax=Hydrogenophaga sp. TaxID=1904254 RepID=UPI002724957B|nr:molybdopterin-guanine dinucleotide biosynthesis protein B [Hydrogenophaga sp.]MDO8887569.1 molybdopterin-guanine dinucleotide biosynthesis protein B [Hydrogenophaga sp.]MDP2164854.1 molybdopterin-guanine dinucleotide biosynthesis protein B [Hydrogenophaga sp.]MDZ4130007.1 molybdopterin-guanine dinucleotide biosynthesis protein B [Hydrogenophaga sp.]
MRVVGFAGFSGSGKTTLVEQLIPALKLRGQRVSVVKHAHHSFDIDHPGKDTWRHREAGAFEVLAASPKRMVLMRELEARVEHSVHDLLAQLQAEVDWVLVEGFKQSNLPKVEVWRQTHGKPLRFPDDPHIVAIATDNPEALPVTAHCVVLDLNVADDVAAWLVDNAERFEYRTPFSP